MSKVLIQEKASRSDSLESTPIAKKFYSTR